MYNYADTFALINIHRLILDTYMGVQNGGGGYGRVPLPANQKGDVPLEFWNRISFLAFYPYYPYYYLL